MCKPPAWYQHVYDFEFEDPESEDARRFAADEEAPELGEPSRFVPFEDPLVRSFGPAAHQIMCIKDALPLFTANGKESIARTRLMLNCFQGVKGVMVCGKLMDGLQADGQRPRFNLHPKVKAAAYKVHPLCKETLDYLFEWIMWWAEMNGLRVAAIKILENEAEGWTGHKLHKDYPHYFRVVFHLPLVEGCESGLVAAYGKGASARRIWISDQQGRVALGASSYGLSVMHCLFYHAAAVRGHSLSVVVDFHHKDA